MNRVKLSKTLSYILRHHPENFGLELNPDGTVKLEDLIDALQKKFPGISYQDIKRVVEEDTKGRFSLLNQETQIRANYGHSIEGINPDYDSIKPPRILFHGTARRFEKSILSEGLKPMGRNFVHLSKTKKEAINVGKRRDDDPLIFKIKARNLAEGGNDFFRTGRGIYLTTYVPPEYIYKE